MQILESLQGDAGVKIFWTDPFWEKKKEKTV